VKSILVVEDSSVIMELIKFLLTTFGYESKEARDRFESLKIAKENRFDLILLDMQLPGFNGFEVLKVIKKAPEIQKVPIIALTAHVGDEDIRRCEDSGMDDYLRKPFKSHQLGTIVRKHMPRDPHKNLP